MSYKLFYAGYNRNIEIEQIGLAISSNLKTWDYVGENPVIPVNSQGEGDESQTSNPCVIKHKDTYLMWYQGKSKDGKISICLATSPDGVNWKSNKKTVFSLDINTENKYREGFHHPHVIFDNGIFKMWCVVYSDEITTLAYTESVDGLIWGDLKLTNIYSSKNNKYWYPFIFKENSIYRMWFTEKTKDGFWQIHYATSEDGLNWKLHNKPAISPKSNMLTKFILELLAKVSGFIVQLDVYGIGSPYVWKEGNKYFLVGHSVGPRGKLFISLYVSSDGVGWKKVKNNIIHKPNTNWNNFFQADPYIYVE